MVIRWSSCEEHVAILKTDDTSKTIVNVDGVLQSTNASAGIPLKEHDGMYPASPVPIVTFFGIDSILTSVFDKKNLINKGQVFSTDNGSWASFGGAVGPLPANRVLIAQLTTDGNLSFELNIQLGTPDGKTENYVAKNPTGREIQFPFLVYPLASPPASKKQ